jgi:hypothetical protein
MTINIKRSGSGRVFTPTAKQGHGQRAAFNAKRAMCNVALEFGSGRLDLELRQPEVRIKPRRRMPVAA